MKAEQAPKTWKDILNPAFKDGVSAKLATSGMQHAQWYMLRKLYGNEFWQEFAKQRPEGLRRARPALRPALQGRRPDVRARRVRRLHALPGEGRRHRVRGAARRAARHVDLHRRGQPRAPSRGGQALRGLGAVQARPAVYQNQKILLYGSLRTDAGPMPTGKRLSDFKLLFPTDWTDYVASHPVFVKEWNSIMGL